MNVADFLSEVRGPNSACARASVCLLATADQFQNAQRFMGRGANRVVSMSAAHARLADVVAELVDVAPRRAARFVARLEARIDGADVVFCQTENISRTGMLLHTDRRYPLGSQVRFEFRLPSEGKPARGVAEVVRHATQRDAAEGIGVRFLSFDGDSRERFERYLERQ